MKLRLYIGFMLSLAMILYSCERKSKGRIFLREGVKDIGVVIGQDEHRMVAFTNKMDSYYQTTTHGLENELYAWFDGWNIEQHRILKDYRLVLDGVVFDRLGAKVRVFPHYLERCNGQATERLYLFDDRRFIEIALSEIVGDSVSMILDHGDDLLEFVEDGESGAFYRSKKSGGYVYLTSDGEVVEVSKGKVSAIVGERRRVSFYLVYGFNRKSLVDKAPSDMESSALLYDQRKQRMNRLIQESTYTNTNDSLVNKALKWFTITMDGLVTHQRGHGIFAGVPWFNEYWGRDTFISLPGGTLVLGDVKTAKQIIQSFAMVQDSMEGSKYYGRIPNIVKVSSLNYHTTDGTPRYISQMMSYIQYSGDTGAIATFYPTVKRSIDGAIQRWTNDRGYLIHADNETWMDARRASDQQSYSPRDEAANDIQSLWMDQLLVGVEFAKFLGYKEDSERWQAQYDRVKLHFLEDYWSEKLGYLADRINRSGKADFQLRPNQLFVLKHVADLNKRKRVIRLVWERLVYPWGVSSLDHQDLNFHPFHLAWDYYHKDAAYHNGTVWQWLNGVAMEEMIKIGGKEVAYQLFENMCHQGMERTGVGMINENSDCFPSEGEDYPKLTGTYWQAWSEAEQLRVWYQYFIGIRPSDRSLDGITISPRIPKKLKQVAADVPIKGGHIKYSFSRGLDGKEKYVIGIDGIRSSLLFDFPSYVKKKISVDNGDFVHVIIGNNLIYEVRDSNGKVIRRETLKIDEDRHRVYLEGYNMAKNISFAQPNWKIKYLTLGQ
ncbi:amylo-alpha-1,6-glucosidase [Prolixibacteraceae bacterium]|nr:amylo-alpha-1,6-glucosidase [Prolixibacteraceae bacterium]